MHEQAARLARELGDVETARRETAMAARQRADAGLENARAEEVASGR